METGRGVRGRGKGEGEGEEGRPSKLTIMRTWQFVQIITIPLVPSPSPSLSLSPLLSSSSPCCLSLLLSLLSLLSLSHSLTLTHSHTHSQKESVLPCLSKRTRSKWISSSKNRFFSFMNSTSPRSAPTQAGRGEDERRGEGRLPRVSPSCVLPTLARTSLMLVRRGSRRKGGVGGGRKREVRSEKGERKR
jgi:hypothetical protein